MSSEGAAHLEEAGQLTEKTATPLQETGSGTSKTIWAKLSSITYEQVRHGMMLLIFIFAIGLAFANAFISRNSNAPIKWDQAHQFAVHSYAPAMNTSMQFTGPFMSKVRVIPNADVIVKDNSGEAEARRNCSLFDKVAIVEKCKMMRSGPMKLGNVANVWSVLGEQSTFALVKNICVVFNVFLIFWVGQYLQQINQFGKQTRNVIVFVVLAGLVLCVLTDFYWTNHHAEGSMSIALSFSVLCFLILCCEYAGMDEIEESEEKSILPEQSSTHLNRNIYIAYALLLFLPQAAILILSESHDALLDVHIQLIFLSFIFYAILDIFQTRCVAVLLCLRDEGLKSEIESLKLRRRVLKKDDPALVEANKKVHEHEIVLVDVMIVKFFVVLAFSLFKFFVLLPSLILLQTQYCAKSFEQVSVGVHYVLFALPIFDIVHMFSDLFKPMHDLFKLFIMLIYICVVLGVTTRVDVA
jgi:hypothetical protein